MTVDFFGNGLCIHCGLAQNELRGFSHFNSETEHLWKKNDDESQDNLTKILEKYPEEHHQEIIESHSWDIHLRTLINIKLPTLKDDFG